MKRPVEEKMQRRNKPENGYITFDILSARVLWVDYNGLIWTENLNFFGIVVSFEGK